MPKIEANIPTSEEVQLGKKLPIMEAFYTLQGEGKFAGNAAYFIRLAGCDVGCVWCDVKESWDAALHPVLSVEEITNEAAKFSGRIAVVTGGEPLMYNMEELTKSLHESNFRTHIETSGAYPLSGDWDWVTLSPKKFKKPVESIFKQANELKIIIYNKSDFKWALELSAQCSADCELLMQPEWSKKELMLPLMIDFVKENPSWRLSLQTHKYLNIP